MGPVRLLNSCGRCFVNVWWGVVAKGGSDIHGTQQMDSKGTRAFMFWDGAGV